MNQAQTTIDVGTAARGCPVVRSSTALFPSRHPRRQRTGRVRRGSRGRLSPHYLLIAAFALMFLLAPRASAESLTGTVKNSTTGKPAAGDEVVLITLGQGMEEAGRTKTDSKGHFSFDLKEQGPHLVRAIHQEVTYHRMAPPGTTSIEVEVYDVGKKIEGIEVIADVMRFQAGNGTMQIERTFAVQNNSKPPRTQMNDHNLDFYVPEGATIGEAQAMTAGGQPVKSAPVPDPSAKGRYSFLFPLRPGETRFELVYTLPYTGSINIDPKIPYPIEHFVAIAPKAMQFSPAQANVYEAKDFPGQPDANFEVASRITVGQQMAFKLTGEGELAAQQEEGGQSGQGGSGQAESRPGGGLGPPIDAPDPLQKYRWWVLAGLAAALIIGGIVVASRQQAAQRTARAGLSQIEDAEDLEVPAPPARARAAAARAPQSAAAPRPAQAGAKSSSALLEALKDELFDLEVEHKQGRITQQEYDKTKAALDQTLQRALKREAQKT